MHFTLLSTLFVSLTLYLCSTATPAPKAAGLLNTLLSRSLPLPITGLPPSTVSLAIDTFFPADKPFTTYFSAPLTATIIPLDTAGLALYPIFSGSLTIVASGASATATQSLEVTVAVSDVKASPEGFCIVFDQPFPVEDELEQTTVGARIVSKGPSDGDGAEGSAVSVTLVRIDIAGGAAVRVLVSM